MADHCGAVAVLTEIWGEPSHSEPRIDLFKRAARGHAHWHGSCSQVVEQFAHTGNFSQLVTLAFDGEPLVFGGKVETHRVAELLFNLSNTVLGGTAQEPGDAFMVCQGQPGTSDQFREDLVVDPFGVDKHPITIEDYPFFHHHRV